MHMSQDRLDLDLLRTFVTVARAGSFTRAGETLFRSQSAISLQVRKLEQAVGERVFRRTARSVTLTPAGERLMGYAERMLALADEALAAFRDDEVSGLVRLGTPEDFATAHLPRALAAFAEAHNIPVDIRPIEREELYSADEVFFSGTAAEDT